MGKKQKPGKDGVVFSTDPNFSFEEESGPRESLPPARQKLRILLETKQRGGKAVTVVYGFVGSNEELETLGKQLKTSCGTGGSVKDGEILVQGDQRDKVLQWLLKNGYSQTKKAGG